MPRALLPEESPANPYSFPKAAIIKHCNLGGLEQHKCIFSQFWKLEVSVKVSAGLVDSEVCEGESVHASLLAPSVFLAS